MWFSGFFKNQLYFKYNIHKITWTHLKCSVDKFWWIPTLNHSIVRQRTFPLSWRIPSDPSQLFPPYHPPGMQWSPFCHHSDFSLDFLFDPWAIQKRNVSFPKFVFFLMYMLSVSSLSPFWLENILSMISLLSDLLSFGYLLSYGLEWKSTNLLFKGPDRKFFRLCAPCDLCHNHSVLLS